MRRREPAQLDRRLVAPRQRGFALPAELASALARSLAEPDSKLVVTYKAVSLLMLGARAEALWDALRTGDDPDRKRAMLNGVWRDMGRDLKFWRSGNSGRFGPWEDPVVISYWDHLSRPESLSPAYAQLLLDLNPEFNREAVAGFRLFQLATGV